ncbi:hypothetical protein X743_00690 [Mesorhizobium sp. LNHC252B00]|nr:hypothetical protein X743_00690 [Mesorhizobium sp. LNHC252B00]
MGDAERMSVLLRCADSAARTCCVSRQIAGRPSFLSSGCSQGDSEPASWLVYCRWRDLSITTFEL